MGTVGGILYYPNNTIQHAGIIIGLGGIAGHAHCGLPNNEGGYFARPWTIHNLNAVTAACMMVKKEVYFQVGGFDEKNLAVAFNDVDFCLRLREKGYLNVYTPYCELYHHESKSRGLEDTVDKQKRFSNEVDYMSKRHGKILDDGDCYYNANLTLKRGDFGVNSDIEGLSVYL